MHYHPSADRCEIVQSFGVGFVHIDAAVALRCTELALAQPPSGVKSIILVEIGVPCDIRNAVSPVSVHDVLRHAVHIAGRTRCHIRHHLRRSFEPNTEGASHGLERASAGSHDETSKFGLTHP